MTLIKQSILLMLLMPLITMNLFAQDIPQIRKLDLKGLEDYTVYTDTLEELKEGEKYGLYTSHCDGYIEYIYGEANTEEGVEEVLNEAKRILELNGQSLDKPRYDKSRYMYLKKDTTTNTYDYKTISANCSYKGGLKGQWILMEWRIERKGVLWAFRLEIKGPKTFIIMTRRDQYEKCN